MKFMFSKFYVHAVNRNEFVIAPIVKTIIVSPSNSEIIKTCIKKAGM